VSQRREGDTKAQIRTVALELFTERGYDATSLREIAERLDITKAALYYHYKNKEDIILSLVDAYVEAIDELLTWVRKQDRSMATREQALERWTAIVLNHGVGLVRFLQNNQQVIRELKTGRGNFGGRLTDLFEALDDPAAPLTDRLRMRLAFLTPHTATMATRDLDLDDDVLLAAAGQVARDLLHSSSTEVRGSAADVRGSSVEVRGSAAEVRGSSVETRASES
jgi:AcrR family transcriptional regulator